MHPLAILALSGLATIMIGGSIAARGENIKELASRMVDDVNSYQPKLNLEDTSPAAIRHLGEARRLELRASGWSQLGSLVGIAGIIALLVSGSLAVLG